MAGFSVTTGRAGARAAAARLTMGALAGLALAVPAGAQVLDGAAAGAQLARGADTTLQLSIALSDAEAQTIRNLVPLMEDQTGGKIAYYATIAYSPQDGLVSESLQSAVGFHSTRAADQAALRACTAAKTAGTCQVAARIVPQDYVPGRFSLSAEATAAFRGDYLRRGRPRAFAVSAATGAWAIAAGPDAAGQAVAQCNGRGAGDCSVVAAD